MRIPDVHSGSQSRDLVSAMCEEADSSAIDAVGKSPAWPSSRRDGVSAHASWLDKLATAGEASQGV